MQDLAGIEENAKQIRVTANGHYRHLIVIKRCRTRNLERKESK